MNVEKEEKKTKGVELLKQLGIYKPYINGFEKSGKVCFFERFGGYWVNQEPEIESKMKEIEEKYDCVVYAITHEFTVMGELYSFLVVTDYKEEWETLITKCEESNDHYAFAYVWNKSDDMCSEFGDIVVKSFGGGITRVG